MIYISKRIKKYMIRSLLGIELVAFVYIYVFGFQGMIEVMKIRFENNVCIQELKDMQSSYEALQQEVVRWEQDMFVREQMARERLQMARKGEEIYYLVSR